MNRSSLALVAVAAIAVVGAIGLRLGLRDSAEAVDSGVATAVTSGDSAPADSAPAESSPAEAAPLRLAVAGDVGTGGREEWRTAEAMARYEADTEYDALLLLGDNIYPDGEPELADEVVFSPFADVLDGGTELVAVLGNHDIHDGNGAAVVAALGMPDRWYSRRIGDVLIVALDSNEPDDERQLVWLEDALASNDAAWTIAMFHHPPYSGGWHGSSFDVRDAFSPLLERFGVDLVLSGHDHDYQRSEPVNGVTYIVSGGAAKLRDTGYDDVTVVATSTHHFVDLAVFPDRIEGRAVDQQGALLDEFTVPSG